MRILAWVSAGAGALLLLLLLVCFIVNRVAGYVPMPEQARNPALAMDDRAKGQYRVAVLGDSQKGLANLVNLVRAVQDDGVEFMLHTGDLAAHNDEGHYRLVARSLDRAGLEVPLYVVPGNHDVKRGSERFRRELGPLEFAVGHGELVFIGIDNASGHPPDPAELERRIASFPPGREVILLMHVPPFDEEGNTHSTYVPFVEWLRGSRVRYLFCGHVHDYIRREIGDTIVIANGVGGDYESWELKQKVYATILEVDGDRIVDRPVELPPEHGFVENLEHLAVGHVMERFRVHPLACWSATLAVAGMSIMAILYLRRKAG